MEMHTDRRVITVVVPTCNRAASLRRTLDSMQALRCPPEWSWELLVVDNRSTDDTRAVVKAFIAKSGLNVQYLFEGRQGASHARNTGIREARGEIIAFTDDDMIPDPGWLEAAAREAVQHPEAAMYCGQTKPLYPELAKIAVREGDAEETFIFPCNPREVGASNNMICRRAIVARVGEFDTSHGGGAIIRAAEDLDLIYRFLRSGVVVRYCPAILAYHNHDRLSQSKIKSVWFDHGVGAGGFYCKYIVRRDAWAARMCYWELLAFAAHAWRNENRAEALTHLAGMLLGFLLRLWVDAKAAMRGRLAGKVWK